MAVIETLTPVHVGTGKNIESPSFREENGKLVRYQFSEVLTTVPEEKLLDPRFLDKLVREQNSKSSLYSILKRPGQYKDLTPLYSVVWTFEELETTDRDIEEQVKTLDVPYIPGSSLKGAIEQGLKYYLLKENFSEVKSNLPSYLDSLTEENTKQIKRFDPKEGFVLQLMDGTDEKTAADFFKDLYGCLLVADVPFKSMEIYEASRENMNGQVVWSYAEAIQPQQKSEIAPFIQIDAVRLKRVREKWASKSRGMDRILNQFSLDTISKACKVYLRDVMECDLSEQQEEFYQLVDDGYHTNFRLFDWVKKMARQLDEQMNNPKVFGLRVGRYTGYYYKTVSWLMKTKAPEIFEEYFDTVFLPVPYGQRNKINLKHFPATRVMFLSHDKGYLPGYIWVEL